MLLKCRQWFSGSEVGPENLQVNLALLPEHILNSRDPDNRLDVSPATWEAYTKWKEASLLGVHIRLHDTESERLFQQCISHAAYLPLVPVLIYLSNQPHPNERLYPAPVLSGPQIIQSLSRYGLGQPVQQPRVFLPTSDAYSSLQVKFCGDTPCREGLNTEIPQ